ncbi:MAG: putative sulfate exporter family transporter, partial [Woeseia sp.]|nr:putative sulfate exporter family transporter [Woeseia sp.]
MMNSFPQPTLSRLRPLIPGTLVSATIALAASYLADHYGAPAMLMALLLGMAFNFLRENDKTIPGIVFCSKTVLRIGVVLLGVRITFGEIGSLGIETVVIVVSGVFTTLSVGYLISRLLGLSPQFSIL